MKNRTTSLFIFFFVVFFPFFLIAQVAIDSLTDRFDEYLKVPEENIYLQLNKSVYMPEEDIGFKAYVLEMKSQLPSMASRNLYCQLINDNNEIVKQKLLLVKEGVAHNIFVIDSLVPPGSYKLKAFTNWMKNFEKPHYAQTSIKILNPDEGLNFFKNQRKNRFYDLQLLPEGGHAVNQVFSKVGVILKDRDGLGINAKGFVYKNDKQISTINLDKNGIGSFMWLPDQESSYEVKFDIAGKTYKKFLPSIQDTGVILTVNEVAESMVVELKLNPETLTKEMGKEYIISVSGNSDVKMYKVKIDQLKNLLPLALEELQAGMNQISLFSPQGMILSERLFFNYENLPFIKSGNTEIDLSFNVLNIDLEYEGNKNGHLGISVLPKGTESAPQNQHIAAKFKLSPYLKGNIQNPAQYFTNANRKTRHNLDNLLLCQGWKMYSWESVLDPVKDFKYDFENGISVKISSNNKRNRDFFMHPTRNTSSQYIELEKGQSDFELSGYFPSEKERFRISKLDKKGRPSKPNVYPRFFPKSFPGFQKNRLIQPVRFDDLLSDISFEPLKKGGEEQLDTVVVNAKIKEERNQKIQNMARGRVDFFDDADRQNRFDILQYLRSNGFRANVVNGEIQIRAQSFRFTRNGESIPPVIVIDDVPFFDSNILQGFNMAVVDYIEIDLSGVNPVAGRFGAPVIKIKTDPLLNPYASNKNATFSAYDVPLSFAIPEKFYRPQYFNYTSEFYNKLGVMDWKGDVELTDGKASFSTPYLGKSEILLIIEGMTSDGTLIHEEKIVAIPSQ